MSTTELGVHFQKCGGLGQKTKALLDKKGIETPKTSNGYHPNGDKRTTVYQNPESNEAREEWESRMDLKYKRILK